MDMEQQLGYLVAKMEENGKDIRELGEKLGTLEKRVDEKFRTAEATFRVLRWIGSSIAAAIVLPWDKITQFVKSLAQ